MRLRTGWPVWLAAALSVQTLAAQTARIRIVPYLRGDLFVSIRAERIDDISLDAIRSSYLPCDWREEDSESESLDGYCRKFLATDGASAEGTVMLAPLILGLRQAGVQTVYVELNDFGRPLDQAPLGWTVQEHSPKTPFGTLRSTSYWFYSLSPDQLPAPIHIRIGTAAATSRLAAPFIFTLFGPVLLALWLRRRAERQGAIQSASVWVHWILTGAWLYWISAVSITDLSVFAVQLQLDSMVLTFLIGSVLFSFPPLMATASCIAVLMPPAEGDDSRDTLRLVVRSVAREAVFLVPFGMFLVGTAMFDQSWQISTASLPVAWLTYKVLSWLLAHWSSGRIERVTQGSLLGITDVIARRAGVKLGGLYLIGNRSAREANAFASRHNVLAVTRGLVERLTRRELTAVIGHEVGHMRGKHVGWRMAAFWGYMLVIGPLSSTLVQRFHLPSWILSLPLLPIAYILVTSMFSRKNEFAADAAAAELVNDPEGVIAALARLSSMTRMPVNWGGIQGAILSHPSMRARVLAIANRFGVAEERALALLHDPDLLARDTPSDQLHYEIPPECSGEELVFSSRSKMANVLWGRWINNVVLAALTLALGHFALRVWPRPPYVRLGLLAALPVIVWMHEEFGKWLDRCYFQYLRGRLRRRLGAGAEGGLFVGLLPRGCVSVESGFYAWDIGFLWLSADALEYVGERASFSVARDRVSGIEVGHGPSGWRRSYGVLVSAAEGEIGFSTPDRGLSAWRARRLKQRLDMWRTGQLEEAGRGRPAQTWRSAPHGPIPQLPAEEYTRGWRAVRFHAVKAAMLWLGLSILMPFSMLKLTLAAAFVPFMTPVAYLLAVCPSFIRKKPPERVVTLPPSGNVDRKEDAVPVPVPDDAPR